MPVTVDAPLHVEVRCLPGERHPVHPAVTGFATHAFVHVNAVVEIDEIRKIVHTIPLQRNAGVQAVSHRRQNFRICPNLLMTVHAGRCRRDAGERRSLDGGVTVTAIDADSGNVVLMAEWDRLL